MSIPISRRLTIALSVLCVGLIVLSGYNFWNYAMLKIRVAFAQDQTQIFEDMRIRSLHGDLNPAQALRYVINYYPSGTKLETGSSLDAIVERSRTNAIREIIGYLRTKTGEDLGDSPDPWIKKYGNH